MMEVFRFIDIDSREANDFLELPAIIYRKDKRYIAPLKGTVIRQLDMNQNPFFEYGSAVYFIIKSGNNILGRIAAFRNPKMDRPGIKVGTVGFFESINDREVANRLLDEAIDWLRNQGCAEVWGPMNSSIWNSYRFKIDQFEEEPFLGEPYNPAYYVDLFESYGFKSQHQWYSNLISTKNSSEEYQNSLKLFKNHFERTLSNNYVFSYNRKNQFDKEFQQIYDFFLSAFDGFLGYYKISYEEFRFLYYDLERIIGRDQIVYVNKDNEIKGIMIQYDDYSRPFRAMSGKTDLLAKARFVLNNRRNRAILALVGLSKDEIQRHSSLAPALSHLSYKQLEDRGIHEVIHMLMSEGNASNRFSQGISRRLGTYAVYKLNIN
jgi:hypothetical protein